ncbi:hypothetical protein GUJ93_ZPchr0003g17272 [Zizania palustris]|uniref:Uncharacterized protein n=1 Tax=Zizania palustris TaxID=103762 RepID=A0A8J5S1E8_ZIZPA|nr:hypothetical protein GUJ93_ZPchr0003g17272 [Zizania palustris]
MPARRHHPTIGKATTITDRRESSATPASRLHRKTHPLAPIRRATSGKPARSHQPTIAARPPTRTPPLTPAVAAQTHHRDSRTT